MERLNDLSYLQLNKWHKFVYQLKLFFCGIPAWFKHLGLVIWAFLKSFGLEVRDEAVDIWTTFTHGSWQTKVSYLVMGFGSICRGQILRGILFFLFEAIFIVYMILSGAHWLSKFGTLGTVSSEEIYDEITDSYITVAGDDSFKILLYGLLTVIFIIGLIYTWRVNVKQNKVLDEIVATGKKVKSGKDDLKSLLDDQFHKTLLGLPVIGICVFTVLPIIFMILVAFTSYDGAHDGYANLFTWVGLNNFNELFSNEVAGGAAQPFSVTFGEILGWTLMWAFFATFTNYFLGMVVALMINKKGIKLKKVWRTILVLTSAVPQFISLLYVSKMFDMSGIVNGIFGTQIDFWGTGSALKEWLPRIMIIVVNIWIGIPYQMLIVTGILMNIPQDLYESARIDGANVWQQYTRITLPYMLFVTGPYLLTSFVGNINNFNVIFLLTGGAPTNPDLLTSGGSAGYTDLLITWLFNITTGATANYKLASVIGIMIFIVVAFLSLIVYNIIPSTKNEEDFS